MEVTLQKVKADDRFGDLIYKVFIQLFFNDSKVDVVNAPTDQLSNLLENSIQGIISETNAQPKQDKLSILKLLVPRNKKNEATNLNTSFGDLRTVNILTINKYSDTTIGRTIIELDADILTLLSQEVSRGNGYNVFKLHSYSVFLVTQTLKQTIAKISNNLKKLSKTIRAASFIPLGISICIAATRDPADAIIRYVLPIIVTIITPFLYRYGTRMLVRILIGHFFKTASS